MKLLVVQEQHFTRMPNGEVWVDVQSNSKFWERYLSAFEEVVVCARFEHSPKYDTAKKMRSDHKNVSFIELPNFRGVASLLKNLYTTSKIMLNAMKQCDRIIFRAPSPISMVAYPLAVISGKPFAAEIMNNPYTQFSPESMHNFYQPLLRWLIVKQTKSLCKKANGVSYVTDNVLQKMYPSRARLYGETKRFFEASYSTINMEAEKYSFDEWPMEKPQKIVLVHTGTMQDYRKGQNIFIKAISILRQKGYDVEGILVGDGIKRSELEALGRTLEISDKLDFVGWKAGFEAVRSELKRAQFAVFPTLGEGLPRSVIEAMAQGLLCFGSDVDGMCELLDEKCLVPEFTAESFVSKIECFLLNWNLVCEEREKQFNRALDYKDNILSVKRRDFYIKLKRCNK